jgi:hypothetical protein
MPSFLGIIDDCVPVNNNSHELLPIAPYTVQPFEIQAKGFCICLVN